jgi:hypothetical protein
MEPSTTIDKKTSTTIDKKTIKKTPGTALIHKRDRARFVRFMIENKSSLPSKRQALALTELYKEETGISVPVHTARKFLKRDYKLIGDEAFDITPSKEK